jgi:hypothetical protein
VPLGSLALGAGTEISGLVASRQFSDVLWLHNDSGDQARIYAIDLSGVLLATVELDGISANDFEDIGIDAQNRILVGDLGGNAPVPLDGFAVHRFEEPAIERSQVPATIHVTPETLEFQYPMGAHDAEALFVDPLSGDLFIVTKAADDAAAYRSAAPFGAGTPQTLETIAPLDFGDELITAADISADGRWIVIRTYGAVYAYPRDATSSVAEALLELPQSWPVESEMQGEALAFAADGRSYFTVSEGAGVPIFRYPCEADADD